MYSYSPNMFQFVISQTFQQKLCPIQTDPDYISLVLVHNSIPQFVEFSANGPPPGPPTVSPHMTPVPTLLLGHPTLGFEQFGVV